MSNKWAVLNYLLQEGNIESVIDVVELFFKFIDSSYERQVGTTLSPINAIDELNVRFKEHGIGFQFEGEIIRVDSTYIHVEITKPTLCLLWDRKFKGANEEYLKAHDHYKHGRNKECLTECLKAIESTLKIISNEKKWAFNQTDTAKKLIQVCFSNKLIPSFMQNQFTSLQSLLESGVPTIRNKLGGHGQGVTLKSVDDKITRYALNLTGTNIIFMIEQSEIK